VLEIDIPRKCIVIFDGLYRDMLQWMNHVVTSLKRARLIGVDETCNAKDTGEFTEIPDSRCREPVRSSQGYMLSFDVSQQWKLERGHFVRQLEGYNCGPIACTKILEIFGLVTKFVIHHVYGLGTIRNLVTDQWKRFLFHCNDDLIVRMQQQRPIAVLREAYASKGGNMSSQANTSTFDPLDICFCFDDESRMDIVRLVCCKNYIHRECLLTWLEFESSCPYCRRPIDDIAKINCQPVID
jgi:hypothetical protein